MRIDGSCDSRNFAGREDGLARLGGSTSARRGDFPDLERCVAHVLDHEYVINRRAAEPGAKIISWLGNFGLGRSGRGRARWLLSEQGRSSRGQIGGKGAAWRYGRARTDREQRGKRQK